MFAKGIGTFRKVLLVCMAVLMQAWLTVPAHAQAAPTITSVTPTTVAASGGATIVITGTDFINVTDVFFSKFSNTSVASYTVDSPTQITAVMPALSPLNYGTGSIAVQTATGSAYAQMTALAPATITSITPAFGDASGGTQVVVQGSGFGDPYSSPLVTAVKFGGVAATSFTIQNDNFMSVTVPAGTAGTVVDVEITRTVGDTVTLQSSFTYLAPLPTVTGISPAAGPTNGGTTVVITGTNFVNVTSVDFGLNGGGTTPAQSFTVNSPTQITAVTPSVGGTGHAALIEVRTASGSGTLYNAFTYAPPPTISNVSPSTGDIGGGNERHHLR